MKEFSGISTLHKLKKSLLKQSTSKQTSKKIPYSTAKQQKVCITVYFI